MTSRVELPAIVAFAKNPETEPVKTRLAADTGEDVARQLYAATTEDCLEALARIGGTRTYISCWPDLRQPYFQRLADRFGCDLLNQTGADLGQRLDNSVKMLCGSHSSVSVVGTDVPDVPEEDLIDAFRLAHTWDVMVGPTVDGGYYLIGMKRPLPGLFEGVEWGGDQVLDRTLGNCLRLGLRTFFLRTRVDVDDVGSVALLKQQLSARPEAAPRTRAVLDRYRWLSDLPAQ